MSSKTVSAFAQEFAKKASSGQRPSVALPKKYAAGFLAVLAEEGFVLAKGALDQISDKDLRETIKTLFLSTVAGAGAGAVIGAVVGGKRGAQVGAAVGSGLGLLAGYAGMTLKAKQQGDQLLLSVD